MKTIAATLSAAQALPTGRPIARASVADNGRLHPAPLYTYAYTGAAVHGVNCGSFFLRTRQTSGVNTLDYQKITDPTVSAQWSAWTNLNSLVPLAGMSCVFWTGTYVVIVYQSSADAKLYYRRSTDGVTFGAAALAYADPAPTYTASLGGVSGGATNSGLVAHYNGVVYYGAYNATTNTWAALEATGLTNSAVQNPSLAGLYDAGRARHVLLVTTIAYVSWARFALFAVTRTGVGAFGTPTPYLHSNRQAYIGLAVSQATLNGFWWLSFGRQRPGTASSSHYLACSNDGLHWEDAYPLHEVANPYMEILGALTGDSAYTYLADETTVLRSSAPSYWSNLTVSRYELSAGGRSLAGEGATPTGLGQARHIGLSSVVALIDNRSGAATPPALHSRFTLERGYNVEGSDYYVSAGAFYVTGFRYLSRDNLLELTATDGWGLLEAWVLDQAFAMRAARVDTLLEHFCALAGVHTVTFDASALWATTLSNFTVIGGATGFVAVRALQDRVPFDIAVQADGSFYAFVPAAAPAAVAAFGPSDHQLWPGDFGAQVGVNFVNVVGSPPASVGSDAYTVATVVAAGRRWTAQKLHPRITLNADADALAAALLVQHTERARAGVFQCPPHFALEPGDVVTMADSTYAAAAGPWRVVGLEEFFNTQKTRPFYQRVVVRGTA